MTWAIGQVDDLCGPMDAEAQRALAQRDDYYDENPWGRPDPELVKVGEKAEVERFRKMGVTEYLKG